LVLSAAKPNRAATKQNGVEVPDAGRGGIRERLLGFASLSPTYGLNELTNMKCGILESTMRKSKSFFLNSLSLVLAASLLFGCGGKEERKAK
jgi:hypothetical protein